MRPLSSHLFRRWSRRPIPPESSRGRPLCSRRSATTGQVLGTYVQFAYDPSSGTVRSVLGLAGNAPVLYVGSIQISGFAPARGASARGPTFQTEGYLATITAHDDPTVLLQVRTDVAATAP